MNVEKRSCSSCGHRCRKRQSNNLSHLQKDENNVMVLVKVKHWWCDPRTRAEMMEKMNKLPEHVKRDRKRRRNN